MFSMTESEKNKLIANLISVESFIKREVIPNLYGTSVTIDFGPEETYLCPPYREKKYHLTVSKSGCSIRSGGLGGISLVPTDDGNAYYSTEAGLQLLKEWGRIKSELTKHIHEILDNKSLIENFVV